MKPLTIKDACDILDEQFPLSTQDSWDNSGLIVGNYNSSLNGILISVDINEQVVKEAIEKKCNLVVAHHPLLFKGTHRLTNSSDEQRTISLAIKNDINLFASHTCADKSPQGTSATMAKILELNDIRILVPENQDLYQISTYVPIEYAQHVREAIWQQGAGNTGNYSHCSYNIEGDGTFMAHEGTRPFVGQINAIHTEKETRIETIVPKTILNKVVSALLNVHPYEEPAYNIIRLENKNIKCGYGVVGNLATPMQPNIFLSLLKEKFNCEIIRHNEYNGMIQRVAICTGSGAEFIHDADKSGAQLYITADIKYHQFAEADNRFMIADIGHYESEHITKQLFLEILREKIHNFVPCFLSTINNPVKYF